MVQGAVSCGCTISKSTLPDTNLALQIVKVVQEARRLLCLRRLHLAQMGLFALVAIHDVCQTVIKVLVERILLQLGEGKGRL